MSFLEIDPEALCFWGGLLWLKLLEESELGYSPLYHLPERNGILIPLCGPNQKAYILPFPVLVLVQV